MPEGSEKKELNAVSLRLRRLVTTLAPNRSIRSLADDLAISFSHLAKMLRGDEPLTSQNATRLARYFHLPPVSFEAYLNGKMPLEELIKQREEEKFAWVNFSSPNPPAWRMVLFFAEARAQNPAFRVRWLQNILVFFALADLYQEDRGYYAYLTQKASDHRQFVTWIESLSGLQRRLVFHALLFTLRPLQYALEKGILSLDQALSALKDPDKYITYPNFAFQLIAKVLEEEDDELFEALAETAEENNDKNKEELPDWLAGDET